MYVHHVLSMISLSHGWRKFVFGLFRELPWEQSSWKEFDRVSDGDWVHSSFSAPVR